MSKIFTISRVVAIISAPWHALCACLLTYTHTHTHQLLDIPEIIKTLSSNRSARPFRKALHFVKFLNNTQTYMWWWCIKICWQQSNQSVGHAVWYWLYNIRSSMYIQIQSLVWFSHVISVFEAPPHIWGVASMCVYHFNERLLTQMMSRIMCFNRAHSWSLMFRFLRLASLHFPHLLPHLR